MKYLENIRNKIDVVNHLQPYAEVGYYDNNFQASKYNFASQEFSGDVVVLAGVRWNF